jgi:hypothetical protein
MPTQGAAQTVQSTPVRSYTARIALSRPDRATRSPSRSPQPKHPKRPRRAPPPSLDEPALGGLGRSQRCTGRVADLDLHCIHQFTVAARRPQRPRPSQATPAGPHALVAQTSRLRPRPPRDPGRQTRVRCACEAAPWRRASDSAPPPSLGRAPVQPDSSISKSTPSDLEFECPAVAFKIERARYKIVTPGESSATKGCSRHGFVLALRCWHRSCSTRPF